MRRLLLAASLAILAGVTGCSNLQFTKDNRLTFTAPVSRALVTTPVTLKWTMADFTVAKPGASTPSSRTGYFAIFVDRAPVKPGETLAAVADSSCLKTPGCFNTQYLAVRNVYTTTADTFTITQIPQLNTYQTVQLHEVTVVLMNTAGQRIGESAWYIDFRLQSPTEGA